MEAGQLDFGIFTLVGVIMLVLSGASIGYLLSVKNKSRSSHSMLLLFVCVILSSLATILTNTGTPWSRAFAPAQDAFLILGSVFLVQFAYWYPENDQPDLARWIVPIFLFLALIALSYASFFFIQFLSNLPDQIDEINEFYLITPITLISIVVIFFMRSIHWSSLNNKVDTTQATSKKTLLKNILKPGNLPALGLRNFGYALALGLIPAVITLENVVLPSGIGSFLFNFGVVVALAAIMLVYLNHAPEPSTISAKLVGISLVTVLLILGLGGVLFVMSTPQAQVHNTVVNFIYLVLLSALLILLLFPLFFRSNLLIPLGRLIGGVRTAEEGKLDTQVEVQYRDEIGFLTRSFNHMIHSLNEATQALKKESTILEKHVSERTAELRKINQQLTSENNIRRNTEEKLDCQLRYEQSLAKCSQSLLRSAEDETLQIQVLNQSLEHLRAGALASRAYAFRNSEEPEMGFCMGIFAEACASEITAQLPVPANQKVPWSRVPDEMFSALKSGQPYGGPVETVFASKPNLIEMFFHQANPLLSVQFFPIFINDQWWGFIGFDDCITSRLWDEREIMLLSTASEMIGSTLQRWQAETELCATLETLEARVEKRTLEFARANYELRHEIYERQHFQAELEIRLEIEKTLARVSTRLLGSMQQQTVIQETLADLGQVVQASRVVFLRYSELAHNTISGISEWCLPGIEPLASTGESYSETSHSWFRQLFKDDRPIFIRNPSIHPEKIHLDREALFSREADSLLLLPISVDHLLSGVIVCSDLNIPDARISENIQACSVIASMLGSMLDREALLTNLEGKVTDRTRELSTFFDLAMLSSDAQEISDIMQPALVKIIEMIACDAAMIHIIADDRQSLKLVAWKGISKKGSFNLQKLNLEEKILAWIDQKGAESDHPSSSINEIPECFILPDFHTATHISLRARGKIQGLMSCYRQADLPFNPYQVTFLSVIGEQLGMAVENYRLRLQVEEVATIQERQRLARELHDAVSQSLYSLVLFAHSGRDALETGDELKLSDSLEQIEVNSLAALKEMRLLLYQLRSLALEEGGLLQAIETRFNLVERRSGIQAEVRMDTGIPLTARAEQEIFRLITEALNNILKHAGASQVSVIMERKNGQVDLVVTDNGCGFDPSRIYTGMGLQNMRERASNLGGRFEMTSQPASGARSVGTQVHVQIPLN